MNAPMPQEAAACRAGRHELCSTAWCPCTCHPVAPTQPIAPSRG
jgi:hypothetical protein